MTSSKPAAETATQPLLHANSVTSIRSGRVLFSEQDLQVYAGQLWQVTGPNGAGKSTLLRMLAGLLVPEAGDVFFNGQPLSRCRTEYHQQLLYIGHKAAVKSELTALENLYWQRRLSSSQTVAQLGDDADWDILEQMGLLGLEEQLTGRLSAGQQRRVSLSRLWFESAPLWILDEPFTSLDVFGIELLQQRFQQHLGNGGSIVMTSHQPLTMNGLPLQQLRLEEAVTADHEESL